MTKIEWLKLAIKYIKDDSDRAIKYINEVIELEKKEKFNKKDPYAGEFPEEGR